VGEVGEVGEMGESAYFGQVIIRQEKSEPGRPQICCLPTLRVHMAHDAQNYCTILLHCSCPESWQHGNIATWQHGNMATWATIEAGRSTGMETGEETSLSAFCGVDERAKATNILVDKGTIWLNVKSNDTRRPAQCDVVACSGVNRTDRRPEDSMAQGLC
jgi:hypothetical protein